MKRIQIRAAATILVSLMALNVYAPPTPPISRIITPYITTLGSIPALDPLPDGTGMGFKLAAVQHGVSQTFDAASGLLTGSRRHSPLVVIKQLDHATPLLYKALADGQTFPAVTIKFYGTVGTNAPTAFFTYTLSNAKVVSIRNWQPNANDPAAAPYAHPEEVAFIYGNITWAQHLEGASYTDLFGSANP